MSTPTPPVANEITEAEEFLVRSVARGEVVDLKRSIVRGSVLRDLILEARPGWVVPHAGMRLQRVIIDGGLDLEGCTISKPILLWHSRIQGGGDRGAIILRDAKLKRLGIHSCTIEGAIIADRTEIENGVFLGGGLVKGVLQIRGADVGGALAIEGTEIGDGKSALLAAGLRLTGPLILRRARVKGEVAFPRAELGAGIYGEDAVIVREPIAVNGESARVTGDILLDRANITGSIKLSNARVGGQLSAEGIIVAATPNAVLASGINVAQGINLSNGRIAGTLALESADIGKSFRAEGLEVWGGDAAILADVVRVRGNWDLARSKLVGHLACPGAEIDGQLRMTEARLFGNALALRADGARIRGGCYLSRATVLGLLRFPAAEIGNQFRLRGASLKVEKGAALIASGSRFARDVELDGGLQSSGGLVFDQTDIGGACDLTGSRLVSATLGADNTDVVAPAAAADAVDGWDDIVLSFVDAKIDRLVMPEAEDQRPRGIVDLSRAHVGSFLDFAAAWPPGHASRAKSRDGRDVDHMVLDGFVYDHLGNPAGSGPGVEQRANRSDRAGPRRLQWLEGQAEPDLKGHFKPQAWVALAHRLAAQGHHDDARTIMIARRRRERSSAFTTAGQRWQGRILDTFALYGYNPWRTVLWMAFFVLAFAGMWAAAASQCKERGCFDESAFVITNRDGYTAEKFAASYPAFNALAYSFDVFVPFVAFGYEDHWRPNLAWQPLAKLEVPEFLAGLVTAGGAQAAASGQAPAITVTMGGVLYVLVVIEILLGLVLASLAVTGFTGLLRGET